DAEVVRYLITGERVRILVRDERLERQARGILRRAGVDLDRVDWLRIATDRSWTRDYCPLFVRGPDGATGVVGWRFNGWAKYSDHRRDAAVPRQLARRLRHPLSPPPPPLAPLHRPVLPGGPTP